MRVRLTHVLLILVMLAAAPAAFAAERAQQNDPRFFAETGYRIASDELWKFFQGRGGTKTFGLPTSREMTFKGFTIQFFQRAVMQIGPNGVETLNLLEEGLLPYTTINGSTFPAPDPALIKAAPAPNDPEYTSKIIQFVKENAPDTWEGMPVNFNKTFSTTVDYDDAFPNGGPASLLPLFNLQIWGAPTAKPTRDPKNNNFVYLRFQRGIMHYDDGCKCTQGLLLGDYLKALITGENLPADLEAQAADNPLLRQYQKSAGNGIARAGDLPSSNFKDAFEKMSAGQASTASAAPASSTAASKPSSSSSSNNSDPDAAARAAAQAAAKPSSSAASSKPSTAARTAAPAAGAPQRAASPEYGMNVFVWGNEKTTDRDLNKLSAAGFGWQKTLFQWRFIEPERKGKFDWTESDRIVKASKAAGVKILARLDQQPAWARADRTNKNAPPDNYQDYADFITALVTRYSSTSQIGRIDAIQIWNEQNLNNEWGGAPINQQQAQDYVRLLKAGYEAAKAADPAVTVITGGVAQTGTDNDDARPDDVYVRWMYEAGAKPYFDVLGAHGHGYKAPPTVSPDEAESDPNWGGHRFFVFRRVEDMRQIMVDNGDADKQIWLLEFGWTSDTVNQAYAWHRVSEEEKGDNLVGAYKWAAEHWAPWIGVMCLWTMPDPSWQPQDEKYWWAIMNPDGTPRAAYDRLLQARKSGLLP